MSLARASLLWSSIGCFVLAACGGVTTDNGRLEGTSEGGSGGSSDEDGGSTVPPPLSAAGGGFSRPEFGAGGTGGSGHSNPLPPVSGGVGPIADGGAGPIGDGGAPSWAGGGAGGALETGGSISVDAGTGNTCRNVLEPMNWEARCAPLKECLNLDPASWTPASPDVHGGDADAATPEGTTVAEMRFCSAPANRRYLFAFEESGAWYDDFNIATGDEACVGRNLAFMGIGGVGDAPLARVRTHCFSIDGSLLGSRIAVVARDRDAVISNLRAVSSCPCPYPIPYNVNSCPGVQGSAGHPNCG